ncbi:hypothetical protein PPL_10644 [Heterostelium album PN500]|uniref:B box-type domain-containing protein n=1 Tax=Heterostelium pallidum (strain ATCC 26659 / Pp 5 / PN500) TaxID=670386 RepID=D3BRN3_HETP5|nr:hypothetical protein PPL_10644 [Heterostelium album PN500]EFA76065.1 hypothetical protein PPL_10644 [Heterostelium album PN500]|eukprot:XP_020428199.1 hypothetical protein PPL_10644 [Heterostelium album PN500]
MIVHYIMDVNKTNNINDDDDDNEYYKCPVHHRCLEFLCRSCNVMLCANCSISACHRGHVIEDFDTVVQTLHSNGQLQQRLDELWLKTKENDLMIERFKKTEDEVTEYYSQLHEFLMVEEHKIKKPLRNEREKAEQNIQSILQEMKEINNVIATVSNYTNNKNRVGNDNENEQQQNHHHHHHQQQQLSPSTICTKRKYNEICQEKEKEKENSNKILMCEQEGEEREEEEEEAVIDEHLNLDICIEKVMKSIRDMGSVSELIEKNSAMFQVNQCEKPIELLHLVQKYMTLMKCNGDPNPPPSCVLRLLDIEKAQAFLGRIYELLDGEPTHDRANYLFTTGADGSFIFDISSSKWTKISDDPEHEHRRLPLYSVVSDGRCIYVFGGHNCSATYSRLCIESTSWDKSGAITTGEGGYGISACYDGARYIYLTGGCYNKINLKRIDRFDTQTLTFSRVGNMAQPRVGSYSFYHAGCIYIVGGVRERMDWPTVLVFDTVQGKLSTLIEDIGIVQLIISACFDGNDLIYILDKQKNFFTISISTKTKTVLSSPNITGCTTGTLSTIYLNTCNINSETYSLLYGEVYLIGGKQYGNHIYCVGSNTWHFVNDHDQQNRVSNGSIKFLKNKPKA